MKHEQRIHDIVVSKRISGWGWKRIRDYIETKTKEKYSLSGLRGVANRKGWIDEIKELKELNRETKQTFSKEVGEITTKSLDIQTVEDLLEYADVDQSVWEVDRYVVNTWDVTMGARGTGGDPETYTNYQVKVWLKRLSPSIEEIAIYDLCEDLKKNPIRQIQPHGEQWQDEHVLFLGMYDHHFGKLAWAYETGSDYDLNIAYEAFIGAVEDLLLRAAPYKISKIVFPIGNDFFQIDSMLEGKIGVTTSGTPQDTDGRLPKIFKTGMKAVFEAVSMCAQVAPVEVIWVPGNHDWHTSFYLTNIIEAKFDQNDRVMVDTSPNPRKYKRYGKTLIGLTHGNEEKHADLPALMAGEAKEEWAKADDYVWFLGHFHRRREMRFNAGDTFGAVRVLILPSLSGTDAWHHKKGYVKSERAAEAYIFHPEDGYMGHISVKLRKELRGKVD